MTLVKKILSVAMAVLLLLSACACGNTAEIPEETEGETNTTTTEAATQGETLDIPETRYDGTELVFLTRDEAEWTTTEIFAEKDNISKSNISEAVYTRNDAILQHYGVTVKEYKVETPSMPLKIQQAVSAGGEFDAVISNADVAAMSSSNGYIWNLNSPETSSLDFTKSWWDQKLVEGMTINDMVFFATGDLLTADNDATFVMMFNKKLASEAQLPNLYELVKNNEWTFDKLYEYEQLVKLDKNGDGKLTFDTDVAGFAITNDVYYSMLYAGGVSVISRDSETGDPIYSLDVDRAQSIAEKARRIFSDDLIINMNLETSNNVVEVGKTCFGDGHTLFFGEVLQCVERMRGYDVDFGVIPYPLYDTDQSGYHHMMHKTGSVVSITRNISSDIERVSSMIEAMAYYSQNTLTKQYYDINLTTKFAKDEASRPMIDLILSSRVFDLSYYYNWGGILDKLTNALHAGSNASVASSSQSFSKSVTSQMGRAIKNLEKAYKAHT